MYGTEKYRKTVQETAQLLLLKSVLIYSARSCLESISSGKNVMEYWEISLSLSLSLIHTHRAMQKYYEGERVQQGKGIFEALPKYSPYKEMDSRETEAAYTHREWLSLRYV